MKVDEYKRVVSMDIAREEYARWAAMPADRLLNVARESRAMELAHKDQYDAEVAGRPSYAPGPTRREKEYYTVWQRQARITHLLAAMVTLRQRGVPLPVEPNMRDAL